ncbi:NAD(P)-dependent alcohol dehydrogenase [Dyella sp. LX-66]|uniref:NAD(P)-dependent alcohol dehydrogenase n=1 Tax=unclassified Dyella TaxID=2634549 RepID=UPI001BE02179|nr:MULTISPECIES: NAD(P)-dependent alcohol dehydrogenase [unclassified Dyella]MBT2117554.1 NAD(P)-dependent alcohol dehydrogenase [Dyella sp. LX-1]MBT2141442.1 NAD(P)-dependent alcohol dehydrogenase [Dyella sp. LX-66]
MKRIQYSQYGGPDVMTLARVDLPEPGHGEVAVKVRFAAINPVDWKVRHGQLRMLTGKAFPRAMGSDFAGTVFAVGPGVSRFKPGDAVFGLTRLKESGAFGEAVIAQEALLAKKPDHLAFEDAACLATPGITAWNGLVDKTTLRRDSRIFINGCTGAVGAAAVQLARSFGAQVHGSTSAQAMARARSLGVEVVYDYRTTDLSTLSDRYDVVYDTAATMDSGTGLGMLEGNGVFLDIDPTPGKFMRALFNRRFKPIVCTPRADILDSLAAAAAQGWLRLPVARIVPLDKAIGLIAALETGTRLDGKGLVAMD